RLLLGLSAAGMLANPGTWPIMVAAGSTLRARHRANSDRCLADGASPIVVEGRCRGRREAPGGCVIRAGGDQFLLDEESGELLAGRMAFGRFKAVGFRTAGDPSAFDAAAWARMRGWQGRAEWVGAPAGLTRAPGLEAALDRTAWRIRQRVRQRLGAETLPGALAVALLIGDRSGLPRDWRESFRRAGIAHVLALSGMHAGLLGFGAGALLRTMRLPTAASAGVLGVLLTAFAWVAGGGSPVVRAVALGTMAGWGRALGRSLNGRHALGLVAGVMLLLRPELLRDPGFRLSFTAAGVLTVAGAAGMASSGRLAGVLHGLAISAAVTLATAPEVAGAFGRISILSPVTTLLAAPLAAGCLGWGALAGAFPIDGFLPDAWAAAARIFASGLLLLAKAAAAIPGTDHAVAAPGFWTRILLPVVGLLVARRRLPTRRERHALAALCLLAATDLVPRDRLTILDVGQGDSILVEEGAQSAWIDGGPPGFRGQAGRGLPALLRRKRAGARAMVATHAHADHVGGLVESLTAGHAPRVLLWPGSDGAPPRMLSLLLSAAEERGTRVLTVTPGKPRDPLKTLRVLATRVLPSSASPENDRSLVARWEAGAASAFLTGDRETTGEEVLVSEAPQAPVIILKAGHHGGRTSTGEGLLQQVDPRIVVASCGRGNPHGHPHEEVRQRLRNRGIPLLTTEAHGSVMITATRVGFRLRWWRGFPRNARLRTHNTAGVIRSEETTLPHHRTQE
ncbi:MAG: ComEC/Rec2 family competence protein, partial [Gemmatimonadota bacterium]|nr:ComEC/Rec2 family competence protein [Gemmatimonadota bacterium]